MKVEGLKRRDNTSVGSV